MVANTTTLVALLKEHFETPFTDAMRRSNFLLNRVKRGKAVGKEAQWKIHYSGNASAGSYNEYDNIVAAGHQSYKEAFVPVRQNWISIEVTGLMQAASKGAGGFFEALSSETREGLEDLKNELNGQILAFTKAAPSDLDGIGVIVDDGQVNAATTGYATIPFTANPWWRPYVHANGGVPRGLQVSQMQDVLQNLKQPARRARVSAILGSYKHWYDYGNLLGDVRRYTNTMKLDGGFTALAFENIPFVAVEDMQNGSIFFLDESQWSYDVLKNFEVVEKDVQKDARRFVITHYSLLRCKALQRQGRIADLA